MAPQDQLAELRARKAQKRPEGTCRDFDGSDGGPLSGESGNPNPSSRQDRPHMLVVPSGPREFGTDSPAYEFVGIDPRRRP